MLPSIIAKLTKIKDPVPQELKDMEKDLKGKNVEVVTRRRGWGTSLDEAFSEDGYETTSEKLDNKNPPKEKVEKNVFDDLNKEPNSIQEKTAYLLCDKYPVDTYEQIIKAASYWKEHYKEFTPEERKEYCENLSEKMATCLLPVPKDIQKYASKTYAIDTELNVNSRKNYVPEEYHEVLDNLIEKIGQVTPQTYSNALKAFDEMFQLDRHYDIGLNDYIASTFGQEKIAQDDSWRYSYNEVHIGEEHLDSLKNEYYALKRMIGEDKAEQFIQHPKKTFETLDKDHKYIIGRLAMQTWSRGGNLHE